LAGYGAAVVPGRTSPRRTGRRPTAGRARRAPRGGGPRRRARRARRFRHGAAAGAGTPRPLARRGRVPRGRRRPRDRAAAARLRPCRVWPAHRIAWVYRAFGRLAQAGGSRGTAMTAARRAVRDLRRAADTPVLRAFHQCARAGYLVLAGRPAAALRRLERADR